MVSTTDTCKVPGVTEELISAVIYKVLVSPLVIVRPPLVRPEKVTVPSSPLALTPDFNGVVLPSTHKV